MNLAEADDGNGGVYNASAIQEACEVVIKAVSCGEYIMNGRVLKVRGDLQKARLCQSVQENKLAMKMITCMQATNRKVPGTQEIRQEMRHEITGFRVFYGTPMMVTISPNEMHNTVMLRMHRTRRSDPAVVADFKKAAGSQEKLGKWGGLLCPEFVEVENMVELGEINIEDFVEQLPDTNDRQKLLARDPLASVYGFHMLCRIILRTLFGVRCCSDCPDCNLKTDVDNDGYLKGCVDAFGSVAESEGGIFGRVDGYYGSIECQKAGEFSV